MRPVLVGAAVALAAASAGVVIPALRALAEASGGGPGVTGGLVAAHVAGGAVGAALAAPVAHRLGGVRPLVLLALVASALGLLALRLDAGVAPMIAVRAIEGACHLAAVTALIAAGVTGDERARTRRGATLGLVLVLGIGGGIGLGGVVISRLPGLTIELAAGLAAAAALLAGLGLGAVPATARRDRAAASIAIPPALIALGERFTFGVLAVAVPYLLDPRRTGAVLGGFMLASVVAIPIGRVLVERWSARALACRSATLLAFVLAAAGLPGALTGPAAAAWAIAGGLAAGGLYAAALALVASHAALGDRLSAMAAVHAAGNAGHALGALSAGGLLAVVPPATAIALLGVAVVALGVGAAVRGLPAAPARERIAS